MEDIGQEQDKRTQQIVDQVLSGTNKHIESTLPNSGLPPQQPLTQAEIEFMQQHMQAVGQLGAAMMSLNTSSTTTTTTSNTGGSPSAVPFTPHTNTGIDDGQSIPLTTHELERQQTRVKQVQHAFQLHMMETETRLNFLQTRIDESKTKQKGKKHKPKVDSDAKSEATDGDELTDVVSGLIGEKETLVNLLEKCGGPSALSPENLQLWTDLQKMFETLPSREELSLLESEKE